MCGCGTWEWCNGGCSCGCDHDTQGGMRRQGEFFAAQHRLYREAGENSFQTGYAAGLDAARKAVAGLRTYGDHGEVIPPDEEASVIYVTDALAAIDALREQPADQTGYKSPNARNLAADLITEYAEAHHQRHDARYDCGRCDLTAALRAAGHDIRTSS